MRFKSLKDDLLLPVAKEGEKESIPVHETTAGVTRVQPIGDIKRDYW